MVSVESAFFISSFRGTAPGIVLIAILSLLILCNSSVEDVASSNHQNLKDSCRGLFIFFGGIEQVRCAAEMEKS